MKIPLTSIATVRFGVHAKGLQQGAMGLVQSSAIGPHGAVQAAKVDRTSPHHIRFGEEDLLQKEDVLFIGRGAQNLAAVWPGAEEDTVASSMLFVIRPDPARILPAYLAAYLNSRPAQAQLAQYRKPGSTPAISRQALDQLAVPLPPMAEQWRMVALARTVQGTVHNLQQLCDTYAQLLNAAWANFTEP